MRTIADPLTIFRDILSYMQEESPFGQFHRMRIHTFCLEKIFTSGQFSRFFQTRILKQFFRLVRYKHVPMIQDHGLFTKAVYLIPVMRHKDHRSLIVFQHLFHFPLQIIFQINIQCGKWFIQKNDLRFICHDPRQCCPLLLPAGKFSRKPSFQTVQLKFPDHLPHPFPLFLPASRKSGRNILFYGHIRKKRIILEQISCPTILRFHIDLFPGIKNDLFTDPDRTGIRGNDPRNTFQSHTLPAPRRSKNPDSLCFTCKPDIQCEISQFFLYIYEDPHLLHLVFSCIFQSFSPLLPHFYQRLTCFMCFPEIRFIKKITINAIRITIATHMPAVR